MKANSGQQHSLGHKHQRTGQLQLLTDGQQLTASEKLRLRVQNNEIKVQFL